MTRIEKIKSKLQELKNRDKNLDVFGAPSHKYNFTKVSESEIKEFESKFSVTLPEEYRTFLLEIGCGAGPYYGICSFERIKIDLNDWEDFFYKGINLSAPFKFNNKDTLEFIELNKSGVHGYYFKILSSVEGWMPICHHGCSYYSILVLNGE